MIPVKHIDPDDLALYAMQLLSPEETAGMRDNLQNSLEARRMLAEVQGDLAIYALSSESVAVPAASRTRLIDQIARERRSRVQELPSQSEMPAMPTQVAEETQRRDKELGSLTQMPSRPSSARVLPWIGWAVAAGLAVEAGTLYQQRGRLQSDLAAKDAALARTTADAALASTLLDTVKDPAATRVTLIAGEKPVPQGRATYVARKGALIFLASNLQPLRTDQTYELWLIPVDGHAPISAGTFQPDARGNASVLLPELPKGVAAKAFGVTVEQAGGSATPTMPILLKGAAS